MTSLPTLRAQHHAQNQHLPGREETGIRLHVQRIAMQHAQRAVRHE
jgi:hypothetical protein